MNAVLAGNRLPATSTRKRNPLTMIGAALFLAIVSIAALAARVPPFILGLYLLASLVTFGLYAADKSAARRGAWRIPENTLHMLSLAAGWPGALLAQQRLRHKTKKQSFRAAFRVTVLLNTGAFVWLLTPAGAAALQRYIPG